MFQRWEDLLFLHWDYPAEVLQKKLPPGLTLDTHEGRAYLGVVPFFMTGIRPRFLPAVPWLSTFQELNLRTYVFDEDGNPGVWFFTLDAANPVAVAIARRFFHLPYRHARMNTSKDGGIEYRSAVAGGPEHRFAYPRSGAGSVAEPGSLEFFLFERYYLFSHDPKRDRLFRGQVAHEPYRYDLTPASTWSDGLISECGLPAPDAPPCHQAVATGFPVRIHPLERIR